MPKRNLIIIGIIAAAALVSFLVLRGRDEAPASRPHYPTSVFTITHSDGTVLSFRAELALTPDQQAYGLMFVKSLPEDQGMIFPYSPAQEVAFWMKNTLIPLDMLFISPDGKIGRIAANARPLDETPIPSLMPVMAVIEIAGGVARQNHIEIGDKITSPALTNKP